MDVRLFDILGYTKLLFSFIEIVLYIQQGHKHYRVVPIGNRLVNTQIDRPTDPPDLTDPSNLVGEWGPVLLF